MNGEMCVRHILRHRPSALLVFKGSVPQEVSYWLRVNELELVSVSVGRWRESRPATYMYVCIYIHIKSGAGERDGQLTPACQTAMETGVCVTQCVLALTHGMGEEACAAC